MTKISVTGRLSNKVAVITGAAKGQGAAEARLFAEAGASLVITDVSIDALNLLAKELTDSGANVVAIQHDVSKEADWQKVAEAVEKTFQKADILINNAGILGFEGVEATTMEQWNKIIAVNQTGVWLGMKYIIPLIRKANGGSIINISSIYGIIGSGTSAAYQATKGAVRLLTKTAAVEYASQNIRINSIHPGVIDTDMVTASGLSEAEQKGLTEIAPLKRMGLPIEIAYGALFLAGDESAFMTGSELVIDGGYTAQ